MVKYTTIQIQAWVFRGLTHMAKKTVISIQTEIIL